MVAVSYLSTLLHVSTSRLPFRKRVGNLKDDELKETATLAKCQREDGLYAPRVSPRVHRIVLEQLAGEKHPTECEVECLRAECNHQTGQCLVRHRGWMCGSRPWTAETMNGANEIQRAYREREIERMAVCCQVTSQPIISCCSTRSGSQHLVYLHGCLICIHFLAALWIKCRLVIA